MAEEVAGALMTILGILGGTTDKEPKASPTTSVVLSMHKDCCISDGGDGAETAARGCEDDWA